MLVTRKPNDFIIAHATDLTADGGIAFRHSVAMASQANGTLYSLHANPTASERPMPDASTLLTKWGKGVLDHHKITHDCCEDPVETLLDALKQLLPDILVVGTHKKSTLDRLVRGSTAEALATNGSCATLFLPIGEHGFVDEKTGVFVLNRVVIPIGDPQIGAPAIAAFAKITERLRLDGLEVTLFHAGDAAVLEDFVNTTEFPASWTVDTMVRDGDFEEELEKACAELDTDLIVMATRGQDGLMDLIRGTHTQRILREHFCPVLAAPIEH